MQACKRDYGRSLGPRGKRDPKSPSSVLFGLQARNNGKVKQAFFSATLVNSSTAQGRAMHRASSYGLRCAVVLLLRGRNGCAASTLQDSFSGCHQHRCCCSRGSTCAGSASESLGADTGQPEHDMLQPVTVSEIVEVYMLQSDMHPELHLPCGTALQQSRPHGTPPSKQVGAFSVLYGHRWQPWAKTRVWTSVARSDSNWGLANVAGQQNN